MEARKRTARLLLIVALTGLIMPAFADEALHTFSGIPWGVNRDEFKSLLYEAQGIEMDYIDDIPVLRGNKARQVIIYGMALADVWPVFEDEGLCSVTLVFEGIPIDREPGLDPSLTHEEAVQASVNAFKNMVGLFVAEYGEPSLPYLQVYPDSSDEPRYMSFRDSIIDYDAIAHSFLTNDTTTVFVVFENISVMIADPDLPATGKIYVLSIRYENAVPQRPSELPLYTY